MKGLASIFRRCGIFLGILLCAGIAVLAFREQAEKNPVHFSTEFPCMGTVGRFDWYAPQKNSGETFSGATAAAQAAFQEIVAVCNLRDPHSELSQLNASAHQKTFHCSPRLWEILSLARTAYRETDHVFDVSVKPLMDLWGFYRKRSDVPSEAEIEKTRALTGLDKIVFDDATHGVFFPAQGMAIDLDGIAKGYALDLAAQAIQQKGISSGALDLGGNLRLLEPPPGEKGFSVGIKSPGKMHRTILRPELTDLPGNAGISTSGNYERYTVLDGKKYGHVLDPATGRPAEFRYSATVIAPTAAQADYLSTALYLKPELKAKFQTRGITVLLVAPDE